MSLDIFIAVILAAFLHATWNAMVKNEENKYLAVTAIVLGHVPASVFIILLTPFPSIESSLYYSKRPNAQWLQLVSFIRL